MTTTTTTATTTIEDALEAGFGHFRKKVPPAPLVVSAGWAYAVEHRTEVGRGLRPPPAARQPPRRTAPCHPAQVGRVIFLVSTITSSLVAHEVHQHTGTNQRENGLARRKIAHQSTQLVHCSPLRTPAGAARSQHLPGPRCRIWVRQGAARSGDLFVQNQPATNVRTKCILGKKGIAGVSRCDTFAARAPATSLFSPDRSVTSRTCRERHRYRGRFSVTNR